MAARVQFAPLSFFFHHPRYHHLFMHNIWQRVEMPERLNHFVTSLECFSLSGKDHAGQGGDLHRKIFKVCLAIWKHCAEELNKRIKALLPPLTPAEEIWARICRSLKNLEELRNSIFKILQFKKNSLIWQNEITVIRREIINDLTKVSSSTSLSDAQIDPELVSIKYTS